MMQLVTASVTLVLLLAACGGDAGEPRETDAATIDAGRPDLETPDMTTPGEGGTNGDVPQSLLDDLLDQAAADTGVPIDEINVVTAESVMWSDGSLGCPEPGMAYTQALVPGYRVVLDVDGEETHYHASEDGQFFVCDDPQPPIDNR